MYDKYGMLTQAGYNKLSELDRKYYKPHRWEYLKIQRFFYTLLGMPKNILEVGPHKIRSFQNSDVIDHCKWFEDSIVHDIRNIPWPIETGKYDFLVASEVIEHVRPQAKEVIKECRRISRNGFIGLPYRWPEDCIDLYHEMIDEKTVRNWTEGLVEDICMKYNIHPKKNGDFGHIFLLYKNWNIPG